LVTLRHADGRGDTVLPTTFTGHLVSFPGAAPNVVSVSVPVRFRSTCGNTHTAPSVAISSSSVSPRNTFLGQWDSSAAFSACLPYVASPAATSSSLFARLGNRPLRNPKVRNASPDSQLGTAVRAPKPQFRSYA